MGAITWRSQLNHTDPNMLICRNESTRLVDPTAQDWPICVPIGMLVELTLRRTKSALRAESGLTDAYLTLTVPVVLSLVIKLLLASPVPGAYATGDLNPRSLTCCVP